MVRFIGEPEFQEVFLEKLHVNVQKAMIKLFGKPVFRRRATDKEELSDVLQTN